LVFRKNHKNRTIPGQLSFNNYQLSVEHAILVSECEKPRLKTLIQFMSCLALGTGMIILARNEKSYLWWKTILDLLLQAGFQKRM